MNVIVFWSHNIILLLLKFNVTKCINVFITVLMYLLMYLFICINVLIYNLYECINIIIINYMNVLMYLFIIYIYNILSRRNFLTRLKYAFCYKFYCKNPRHETHGRKNAAEKKQVTNR